jgi:signal transduction histidine kinase/ligand-binding sensor domain-containing protein
MKRCYSSVLLFCLFLLFGGQSAHAQYRFDHWTADNGLPQNSVRDIVQTQDGYLWLATFDGLVRFDGVRFTVFNKNNSPGIITNRFVHLYEDGQGDLWASTENSGLTRLHQGRFTTYTTEDGLPNNDIGSLGSDGLGNLLLFDGFRAFRWLDGRFQPADDLQLPVDDVQSNETMRVAGVSDGLTKVVYFVDGQKRWWDIADFPYRRLNPFPALRDSEGNTWFGFEEGLIKTRNGRVVKSYTAADGLPGKQAQLIHGLLPLQALSIDHNGALWVTDLDSMQSHLMAQQPPEGLKIVLSFADREGNYWFGTLHDGLFRARKQSVTAYAKTQGLDAEEVYPIFEDLNGDIWIGSAGNGLFRFRDGSFTNYKSESSAFGTFITSLNQDRSGRLWINGAWYLEGDRFVRGIGEEVLPSSLGFIWTMYEDSDGARWFGTMNGVVCYKAGATSHYTTKDGLAGDDTKVIIRDPAGGIWIGSYGGLTHFKDGQFTSWTEADGLPGNTVRALYQDGDGALWIGTYDSGLGRLKDGKFTRYTTKDGLFDNGVFQILEDDSGWCWMSCNRGIYRVRKEELNDFAAGKINSITSIAYSKSDGMVNVECNGGRWPAGIKARDGKLWFPTMGGVVVVDPASVTTNAQPPPVVIEDVRIDNKPITGDAWQSALRIEPTQHNFEIAYTALSFINPENLRFKYKLEGLDQDWVEVGGRRTVYFSHVPPGEYTFRVIAANSDGVWNNDGQRLRIRVLPPFYRTWWFLSLAVFCGAVVVFGAYRFRVAQLYKKHQQQQAFSRQLIASQENERQRIAAELHDSLGQNLLIIKNRALLGSMADETTSEPREQFDEIATSASQSIEEVREIAYNLRPYHLDRLGLTNAIEAMIEKVAASTPIRFIPQLDSIDGLFPKEAEILIFRVVQESLNNIVKHSQASEARVRIERQTRAVTITIQDDGRGFSARRLDTMRRGGFGLVGMSERVRLLGGEWRIDSQEGQGTTVTIRMMC